MPYMFCLPHFTVSLSTFSLCSDQPTKCCFDSKHMNSRFIKLCVCLLVCLCACGNKVTRFEEKIIPWKSMCVKQDYGI